MTVQASSPPSGLSRDQLLVLRRVWSPLPTCTVDLINSFGLRRRRDCKAGRCKASRSCKQTSSIKSAEPFHSECFRSPLLDPNVKPKLSAVRSTTTFGLLNVRSLLCKFDDIVELCRDQCIDLLCSTESWHDSNSAVLGRLRCAGYNVIDRPRPRAATADDMSANHGVSLSSLR